MHSPMRGDMQRVPWSADLRRRLMPLFDAPPPVPVRLWAIMDGAAPGRILVDNAQRPSCALIQELAEGTAYLGGRADSAWVHAGVDLLRREQDVVVCLWPDDPRASSLPPAPDYVGEAVDFTERGPADAVALPDGYTLRTIDADVVPRLRGFDYYVAMFGSVTQALAGMVGSCVLWQDAVVSEAVAGPFARGLAEIGNDQPVSAANRYHNPNIKPREFDPERAKALFDKAGLLGVEIPLVCSDAATASVDMATVVQQAGAGIGMNIKVDRVPSDGYWSNYWLKAPVHFGNINPRPTPDILFSLLYQSTAPWNESQYKSEKFDRMLVEARGALDEAKRKAIYWEMQEMVSNEAGTATLLTMCSTATTRMKAR